MKVLNEGDKPSFNLPKAPKVKLKPAPPDQRQIAVMPIRALTDRRLSGGCVRVLALICSYCNRAGITWVGQQRLAADLQTNKQYISTQMVRLRKMGYIETLVKGGKHSHTSTTRVIYNKTINTQDAIGLVNESLKHGYLTSGQATKEVYEAENGEISYGRVIQLKKNVNYDTRYFHKVVYKESFKEWKARTENKSV